MKRKILLSVWILFLAILAGKAQCPDNLNIYLSGQIEVEAFATMYPNCSEIHRLTITGASVSSLESLHFLTSITMLHLSSLNSLTSLSGLENINTTVSELWILDNPSLTDISQLSGISGMLDYFIIENNDALLHLTGLQNIEGVFSLWASPLIIVDNDNLLDLHGLEGITYAEAIPEDPGQMYDDLWDVVIEGNDALQSLEGLGAITNLYDLRIENNNALPDLDGLQNQAYIDELHVVENDALESVDGLKPGGIITQVYIENNNGLVTLNGLDSLASVERLAIISNENLTDITSLPGFSEGISIYENDDLTGLSAFDEITGEDVRSISFYGNEILSTLTPLQDIENLHSLGIFSSPSLENLSGLHHLKQVESWLVLKENQNLNDITSLSQLDTVGSLLIQGNPSLVSLLGFAVDTAHFTSVFIKDKLNLPVCEAVSICNFLLNFSEEENEVEIVNNAPGCNSRVEVEAACGIIGVDEVVFDSPLLKVSPNPAESFFEITLGQESQLPINDVRIFDGMGRLVYQNEPESLLHKIDTKNLPEGIYVVLVNGRYSEKLVIQKWD